VKYLLLADLHVGVHNDSDIWHKVVINLAEEIRDYLKLKVYPTK